MGPRLNQRMIQVLVMIQTVKQTLLKNKIETEKPFNDAPNDGKNERVARALRQTSKSKSWFNPNPTRFIENSDSGRELVLEKADIALNLNCFIQRQSLQ
jgi:hypothetical protein